MRRDYPLPMLDSPDELARHQGWTEDVYRDFLAFQTGQISRVQLDEKYLHRKAILALDLADFTLVSMGGQQAEALLRILDVQKICVPVLREHDAWLIRAFADDLVALFERPGPALDAAFEIHRRMALFNGCAPAPDKPVRCCIGIGYGAVYAIGPNLAMGDEMNRASRLGEDIACGEETLVTENVHEALRERSDVHFERVVEEELLFPFYRATPARGD
jgi:class 3 adenylate cyclase